MRHLVSVAAVLALSIAASACQFIGPEAAGPALSPEGEAAYELLLHTDFFGAYGAGIVAVPSREARAFGVLYREAGEEREAVFKSLLQRGDLAGQLYALTGLYLIDRDRYQEAAAHYRQDGREVQTASGCISHTEETSRLVAAIDNGWVSKAMLAASGVDPNRH